jgi:hypothetical protein
MSSRRRRTVYALMCQSCQSVDAGACRRFPSRPVRRLSRGRCGIRARGHDQHIYNCSPSPVSGVGSCRGSNERQARSGRPGSNLRTEQLKSLISDSRWDGARRLVPGTSGAVLRSQSAIPNQPELGAAPLGHAGSRTSSPPAPVILVWCPLGWKQRRSRRTAGSPHPCGTHGSARPARTLLSTALSRPSLIRMRPEVQVLPGPPKWLLTSRNAGHSPLGVPAGPRCIPIRDELYRV